MSCRLEGERGEGLPQWRQGGQLRAKGGAPGLAGFPEENHLDAPGGDVCFRKQGKVVVVWSGGRGALGPHLYPLPRV